MVHAEIYHYVSTKNMLNNFRNDVKWLGRVTLIKNLLALMKVKVYKYKRKSV